MDGDIMNEQPTIRIHSSMDRRWKNIWRNISVNRQINGWMVGRIRLGFTQKKIGIHSAQTAWCATTFDQDWSLVPEYWAGADVESVP